MFGHTLIDQSGGRYVIAGVGCGCGDIATL